MSAPCKDCVDRQVACHSTCVKYQEWKKECDDNKKRVEQIKAPILDLDNHTRKVRAMAREKWRRNKRY